MRVASSPITRPPQTCSGTTSISSGSIDPYRYIIQKDVDIPLSPGAGMR
ncbi:MAG: hypothetical protein WCK53_08320 [Methanomicrobiales archaeon]